MKTKMRLVPVCFLKISLLIIVLGISGCSSNCPPKGKWSTGDKLGLVGFEVSSCKVEYMFVVIDVSHESSRYGGSYAQQMAGGGEITRTKIFTPECSYRQGGRFNCQQENMTFTGEFLSDSEAQGELYLPMGLALIDFYLKDAIKIKWSATLVK